MMITSIVTKNLAEVKDFIDTQFEMQLHNKQRLSLGNAVIGTLASGTLMVSQMGVGLAKVNGLLPKHAKKQVDRLLSNGHINSQHCQATLAKLLIGALCLTLKHK